MWSLYSVGRTKAVLIALANKYSLMNPVLFSLIPRLLTTAYLFGLPFGKLQTAIKDFSC